MEDYFDWDGNPYSSPGKFFLGITNSGNIVAVHNTDRDVFYFESPEYYRGIEDFTNKVDEPYFGWPIPMTHEQIVELSNRLNLLIITYK